MLKEFRRLYNNDINSVDVWVGGILETKNGPGELFQKVILDQFERIRNGDRFWFENRANGLVAIQILQLSSNYCNFRLFTPEEIKTIKTLKMYDIITSVTKITSDDIQKDVFRVPSK